LLGAIVAVSVAVGLLPKYLFY